MWLNCSVLWVGLGSVSGWVGVVIFGCLVSSLLMCFMVLVVCSMLFYILDRFVIELVVNIVYSMNWLRMLVFSVLVSMWCVLVYSISVMVLNISMIIVMVSIECMLMCWCVVVSV